MNSTADSLSKIEMLLENKEFEKLKLPNKIFYQI